MCQHQGFGHPWDRCGCQDGSGRGIASAFRPGVRSGMGHLKYHSVGEEGDFCDALLLCCVYQEGRDLNQSLARVGDTVSTRRGVQVREVADPWWTAVMDERPRAPRISCDRCVGTFHCTCTDGLPSTSGGRAPWEGAPSAGGVFQGWAESPRFDS